MSESEETLYGKGYNAGYKEGKADGMQESWDKAYADGMEKAAVIAESKLCVICDFRQKDIAGAIRSAINEVKDEA